MHKAVGYILFLVIGLAVGVSVGTIVLVSQVPAGEEQVKVTIQKISCTFSEHTLLEINLENNVPERTLKGNVTVLQDEEYWTSEVKWYFTGDGTAEIICDSINETRNFRVKYLEDSSKAIYLDRIIEWDEVSMTYDFMKTEELRITSVTFPSNTTVTIACSNTGADTLTVSSVTVDDVAKTPTYGGSFASDHSLAKGASGTLTVSFSWTSGYKYTFAVLTASGNKFIYTTTAAP
jgi:hypothetical protein